MKVPPPSPKSETFEKLKITVFLIQICMIKNILNVHVGTIKVLTAVIIKTV